MTISEKVVKQILENIFTIPDPKLAGVDNIIVIVDNAIQAAVLAERRRCIEITKNYYERAAEDLPHMSYIRNTLQGEMNAATHIRECIEAGE